MMVVEGQERGRQGGDLNEKSSSSSWTGSGLLSCAYQAHHQQRHPKSAVTYCSFGLRVRDECETCWRDWRVDSRCVES